MTDPVYREGMGNPLDMLAEEASEIIKERCKFARFGRGTEAWLASGGKPPLELMLREVGDLLAVLEVALTEKVFAGVEDPLAVIVKAQREKHAKLLREFGYVRPKEHVALNFWPL